MAPSATPSWLGEVYTSTRNRPWVKSVAKLDLPRGGFVNQMTLAVLLDPEQFAKIQGAAGDGRVGQAFFKACAAWAWALLKKEHDPSFPDSDDE